MSKIPVLPIVLGVGALGAIFLAGSSKADEMPKPPAPPPPKTGDAGPEVPVKDPAAPPPSTTVRKREVDKSTFTPSHFALKYSGSSGRWKELAAVNPELRVVDIKMTYQQDRADGTKETKTYYTDASGTVMLEWPTLSPWLLGQVVILPPDWKG